MHFGILECACLACGNARHMVLPGLSLKSGIMVFAWSQSECEAGEREVKILRDGKAEPS